MDFFTIREHRDDKKGTVDIYPDFKVIRSQDLMVRGRSFYAIWDEEAGMWSTDEYDVQRLVDEELYKYRDSMAESYAGLQISVKTLSSFGSRSWLQFRNYVNHLSDNSKQLDEQITFANTKVTRTDYVSHRLPYPLEEGEHKAWDEILDTLYYKEERQKIEWAIGAIISGDSKKIQKFMVLYGAPGTGKGTVINLILKLFAGYYATFEAKSLTGSNNAFGTEAFKANPLVAIQHDGDLSRIEDNTKLNSIISHEEMLVNEKNKPQYTMRFNAFLLMGTNKSVKITDAKSGIIRRLIDVRPTGNLLAPHRYQTLYSQVQFELGAIAYHCRKVYQEMGREYYSAYRPIEMMLQTDVFFNFIESHFDVFKNQPGVTLKSAYEMYKQYCEETNVEYKLAQFKFREELKNYFKGFSETATIDGIRVHSWYYDFDSAYFVEPPKKEEHMLPLVMDSTESYFDKVMSEMPAQYAKVDGTPEKYWDDSERIIDGVLRKPDPSRVNRDILHNVDTTRLHYVKVPPNHIVIDFDITDEHGEKSAERNLEEASKWPATYSEYSKSGGGIHLHYTYDGDVAELAPIFKEGIEVKVFTGNSSLRRKKSRCNTLPFTTINSGIPLKEKKMIDHATMQSEKTLRQLIERNLKKEIHPGTKPSVDFIHKILEDAYSSGMSYDVTDMRARVLTFAARSTNQSMVAIKTVQAMKFASADRPSEEENVQPSEHIPSEEKKTGEDLLKELVYYDVEVFPNLLLINWKRHGEGNEVVRMINPTPTEVEELFKYKLVGFNCRRYDNHILYARMMGYGNEQIYRLSSRLVNNDKTALFGEAYNISYTDIYDFSSKKQSLKKFQLELGIHHKELGLPWDEPVPEDKWAEVAEYCDNDVISTEAVFVARYQDFVARQVLADLSGLTVNDTTQKHTGRIIFGNDRKPQDKFEYTDLSEYFPGYVFERGKSTYRGEEVGEGGYVYAEPGMYENVIELDVASMHPTSIEELNLFGPYTKNFSALKKARIAIKHQDYDTAKGLLNGVLAPYLKSSEDAEALSYALKIVINIVYGLTSAKFPNLFRDNRNVDNIVAKRGALFMIDLKHKVQEKGFTVVHIKTDSIKIANPTEDIIEFVMEYGHEWGYEFEHDATYEKICLVNNAVYIAKKAAGRKPAHWSATGAQFQHPYVFKTLFSHEEISFDDLCETKAVQTALYLDFDEDKDERDIPMALDEETGEELVDMSTMQFVGKVGSFCPIVEGRGGGRLLRSKDEKFYAVTGTKGFRWMEAEVVRNLGKEDDVDLSYFEGLNEAAIGEIEKYGRFNDFVDILPEIEKES